jgi:hypothetical protein
MDEAYIKVEYARLKSFAKSKLQVDGYIYDESLFEKRNADAMNFIDKYRLTLETDRYYYLFLSYIFGKDFLLFDEFEFERYLIENENCLLSDVFNDEFIEMRLEEKCK